MQSMIVSHHIFFGLLAAVLGVFVVLARASHVPVVTVTETLSPEGSSFQQWQVAQLERLAAALHRATGR